MVIEMIEMASKPEEETAGNRQFARVPCGKIVQGDPDGPETIWKRKKSEDMRPREGKEGSGLLQAQSESEPFDSGRCQEGHFLRLVRLADNESSRTLCLQGKEGT